MSEYIEREAALDCFHAWVDKRGDVHEPDEMPEYRAIEALPFADVRPVVLCKDCMHSKQGKQALECEKHRYVWNNMNLWVNDDDFCSWGVKKEES